MKTNLREKTTVKVFNLDNETHVKTVHHTKAEECVQQYRNAGFNVYVDIDGDICIDTDNECEDSGKTYKEMANVATAKVRRG